MSKVSLLDRIEKIEKEVAQVKKTLRDEEKEAMKSVRAYEKAKREGKLIKLESISQLLD